MTQEPGIRAGHKSLFTIAVHAAEEGGTLDSYAQDGEEPPIQDQVVKLLQVRV